VLVLVLVGAVLSLPVEWFWPARQATFGGIPKAFADDQERVSCQ